jgi:tRNA A37 threonylcarbamoyladenosine dehydratase
MMLNVNADIHEGLRVKCPFLSDFNPDGNVSTNFSKTQQCKMSRKFIQWLKLLHADIQKADMRSQRHIFVVFHDEHMENEQRKNSEKISFHTRVCIF